MSIKQRKNTKSNFGFDNTSTFYKTKEEGKMLGKVRIAAMFAAMLGVGLGVSSQAMGGEVNVDITGTTGDRTAVVGSTVTSNTYVYSGLNNTPKTESGNLTVASGATLTFGQQKSKEYSPFNVGWTLTNTTNDGRLTLGGSGAGTLGHLKLISGSGKETVVSVQELNLAVNGSTIVLGETNGNGNNTLNTKALTATKGGSVTIYKNSIFNVDSATSTVLGADGTAFNLTLNNGQMNFKNGAAAGSATLREGKITGNGQVGGNITLSGTNDETEAVIDAKGFTQTYNGSVINTRGTINVGGNTGIDGVIDITDNLTISGGINTVKGDAQGNATLNVGKTLHITTLDATNDFVVVGTDTTHRGLVTAKNLDIDTTGGTKAIKIGGFGTMEIGTKGSPSGTDTIDGATIDIAANGAVVLNNATVMAAPNSTFTNDGALTFNHTLNTGNGNTFTTNATGKTVHNGAVTYGNNNIFTINEGSNTYNSTVDMGSGNQYTNTKGTNTFGGNVTMDNSNIFTNSEGTNTFAGTVVMEDDNKFYNTKGTNTFAGNVTMADGNILTNTDGTNTFGGTVTMGAGNKLTTEKGKTIFSDAVSMAGGANDITAKDGATVTLEKGATMAGGNNSITSDNATVIMNGKVTLGDTDELRLAHNGVMDYSSKNNGDLTLGKGKIVSDGAGTNVKNQFLTGNNSVVVETAGGITVKGGDLTFLRTGTDNGSNAATYGDIKVVPNGSIDFNKEAGHLTAGTMTVDGKFNGDIYTNTKAGDVVDLMTGLVVEAGAKANGDANIATTVYGKSTIDGTYLMAETTNDFKADVNIGANGQLGVKNGGNKTASMTIDKDAAINVKSGGTLGSAESGDQTLTINKGAKYNSRLNFNGSGKANTVLGIVDAGTLDTRVSNDLNVNGTLKTYNYNQISGTVSSSDSYGKNGSIEVLNTETAATISGVNSYYDINGTFNGGLDLKSGATLVATGNTITGNLTPGGKQPSFNVDSASFVDVTGDNIKITGFKDLNVDGVMTFGYDATGKTPYYMELDDGAQMTVKDVKNSIRFTDDFIKNYYENETEGAEDWIIRNGEINGGEEYTWTTKSLFGDFDFTINSKDKDGEGAIVTMYDKRDVSDTGAVQDYLRDQYGQSVTEGIADNVSGVAQNMMDKNTGWKSDGTLQGDINYEISRAIAAGDPTWTVFDKSGNIVASGSNGRDLTLVRSGATTAAPVYVAQDSIRNIQGTLHSRLDAFRAVQECVVNECFASGSALGSADILNERYLNRVWAGALGTWQNASARKGYDGYKYKAGGGIVGYDRAVGAAILGVSFAYLDGKLTDKAFERNDSKIRQHNVNAYATYNAASGFYATIMGGYNYSRNRLDYGQDQNNYKEKYGSHTLYASGKIGYDIMPCDNFSISPSIGVNYFYTRSGSHDIVAGGIEGLTHVSRTRSHQVEMPIDVKIAYEIPVGDKGGLTLMANGGYAYNFRDKGIRGDILTTGMVDAVSGLPTTSSKIEARKQGKHSWTAGAGIKFRYDHWDIGVKYDYVGRHKYSSHQVTGTVGYSF